MGFLETPCRLEAEPLASAQRQSVAVLITLSIAAMVAGCGTPTEHMEGRGAAQDAGASDANLSLEPVTLCFTVGSEPERCFYGDGFSVNRPLSFAFSSAPGIQDNTAGRCAYIEWDVGRMRFKRPCPDAEEFSYRYVYQAGFCVPEGSPSERMEPTFAAINIGLPDHLCRSCPQPPRYECRNPLPDYVFAPVESAQVVIGPDGLHEGQATFGAFDSDCDSARNTNSIVEGVCQPVSIRFRFK